jgi:hypothetical protein
VLPFLLRHRRHWPWVLSGLGAAYVAQVTIRAVLERVGHAGATLDDSYIHFQYARAIAEGHPFRFQAGMPPSSGGTSMLWPLALAVFYAVGFRGDAIMWAAWILSYAAYAGLAYEAYAVTKGLASRAAGVVAAVLVLTFGGLQWFAASGMEVLPFAYAMLAAVRHAAEWSEAPPNARSTKSLRFLLAFTFAAALLRPEGALIAVFVAGVLFAFPQKAELKSRSVGLVALAAAGLTPLILRLMTGASQASTAKVKLLSENPYYAFFPATKANLVLLFRTLLNGEVWSAEFLPKGSLAVCVGAFAGILAAGAGRKRYVRAAGVALIALMILVPCTYYTFLWNRLRYLWPFAPGLLIGLACLCDLLAQLLASLSPRARGLTLLFGGLAAGTLGAKFEGIVEDVAQSASGIARQQATLGRWARENLPEDARIGVNDTGAIAYFSGRKTFDVVGLTTASEAKYWVAGAASRLEHYERLKQTAPNTLPPHFIVYPEWLSCAPVLGDMLHQAIVTDSTILGGQIMTVYKARYDDLGSGEAPWSREGPFVDVLDVADLESEEAHAYQWLDARENEQSAFKGESPGGKPVVDGGRTNRTHEAFVVRAGNGGPRRGLVRLKADSATATVTVRANGQDCGTFDVPQDMWVERSFEIPANGRAERVQVELSASQPVTTFHYWFD